MGEDASGLIDSSFDLQFVGSEEVSSGSFDSVGSSVKNSFTLGDVALDGVPVDNVVLDPDFPVSLAP